MKNNTPHQKLHFGAEDGASALSSDRYLVCPVCGEHLKQLDIENFSRCPFCNHKFEVDVELEDFILEPAVENWLRLQDGPASSARES